MTDHPSTTEVSGEGACDDHAAIVPANHSAQLTGGGLPALRGSFAEMILHMAQLPEADRHG